MALRTGYGGVGVGFPLFPDLSLVVQAGKPLLLRLSHALVDCKAPGVTVGSECFPLLERYVAGLQRGSEAVFESFHRAPWLSHSRRKFGIEHHFGQA